MAEVLVAFDQPVRDESGEYQARAVGRLAEDGMWEGWCEFSPIDHTGDVVIGPVESRQPGHDTLQYWATGLTPIFLEGALHRARRPVTVRVRTVEVPASEVPGVREIHTTRVMPPGPEPVLDPFEIGSRNMDVLRQELGALNRPRLLNIISAYELNPGGEDLAWMSDLQLITFIMTAVNAQLTMRAR